MGGFGATGHQAAAITHDLVHPSLPTYLNLEISILLRIEHFNTKEGGQEKHCCETSMFFLKSVNGVHCSSHPNLVNVIPEIMRENDSIKTRYKVDPKNDQ